MDEPSFARLVAAKLSGAPLDETLFFGQYVGPARPLVPFEAFVAQVSARVDGQLKQRIAAIETPPAPGLLTVKSWQHGFTAARDRSEAERARGDALFLQVQSWAHQRVTSARWRACLSCFDVPARWLELARAVEDEGRVVEASALLAAARWLDHEGTREAVAAHVAQRPEGLPARLVSQPDPSFRSLRFGERHWRAWDMKNYALLHIPSLLAFESDESFSVRARVYRSLGQRPHPASIQALHEGTLDPHRFARAQAVRSLGWCADPTFTGRLAQLATGDPCPAVRRAAEQARQRIIGYWTHFGTWERLMADPATARDTAASLIDRGLPYLADDVLELAGDWMHPAHEALWDRLEEIRPEGLKGDPERQYHHWFASALEEEAAVRGATDDDRTLASTLSHGDEASRGRALLVVSAQGRHALRDQVTALTDTPGAVGWGARRVMRCLGWGTMTQRRALPAVTATLVG